jgi:hypothetical protein
MEKMATKRDCVGDWKLEQKLGLLIIKLIFIQVFGQFMIDY